MALYTQCQCSKGCWILQSNFTLHLQNKSVWIHMSQGLFPQIPLILCAFACENWWWFCIVCARPTSTLKMWYLCLLFFESITCRIWVTASTHWCSQPLPFCDVQLRKNQTQNPTTKHSKCTAPKNPLKTLNHTCLQLECHSMHTFYLLVTKFWEKFVYLYHLNEQTGLLNTSLRNN